MLIALAEDGGIRELLDRAVKSWKAPTENISDAYTLLATARPVRPQEEVEPNDDLFSANDMAAGQPVTALLNRKGDKDYFRFPRGGAKGEVFRVEYAGPPGLEVHLEAIAGGLRLPDKLPGLATLPA